MRASTVFWQRLVWIALVALTCGDATFAQVIDDRFRAVNFEAQANMRRAAAGGSPPGCTQCQKYPTLTQRYAGIPFVFGADDRWAWSSQVVYQDLNLALPAACASGGKVHLLIGLWVSNFSMQCADSTVVPVTFFYSDGSSSVHQLKGGLNLRDHNAPSCSLTGLNSQTVWESDSNQYLDMTTLPVDRSGATLTQIRIGKGVNGLWPILFAATIEYPDVVYRVPGDFGSIQAAIDTVISGTRVVIQVSEGIYNETIDFKGKAVTVKAAGSRANTIIDGTSKTTSVVRAVTGESSSTVLQGFTIRNGSMGSPVNTYRLGGGMFIDHASPTIRDCAFVSNAAGYGGGIYGLYSDSLVENCTFSQNTASTDGGGVQFFAGNPVVRGCTISDNVSTNRGGGLHLVQHTTGGFPTLDGCTITGNRAIVSEGGGVSLYPLNGAAQRPLVANCAIQGNTAQGRGGGVYAPVSALAPQPNVTLTNNAICGNTSVISKRENTWALFEDGGNTICDCFSDIDGNGSVNTGDLGFELLFVGDVTDAEFIQPDQDMNGLVDTGDVALLLLNFGQCP